MAWFLQYAPTSQKALFNKIAVQSIRKWVQLVQESSTKRLILCVYGPMGCGKTATLQVLFKPFNVQYIDPDSIRSTSETIIHPLGYNDKTIDSTKSNIILIDNIELCEKTIKCFVESIKVDVPIVLVFNNKKLLDLFSGPNTTIVQFEKPSLLELNKLTQHIFSQISQLQHLATQRDFLTAIVYKSDFDLRQLFYLIEQLKMHFIIDKSSPVLNPEKILDLLSIKEIELDISQKIKYILDPTVPFHFHEVFKHSSSEPVSISNAIFQNYLSLQDINLETISSIAEDLSNGATIHNAIFDNQWWYLYDDHVLSACVRPSYKIKNTNTILQSISTFKDISCNFMNSYSEIKKMYIANLQKCCPNTHTHSHFIYDPHLCFYVAYYILGCTKGVSAFFEAHKKGKNISRMEKMALCDLISSHPESTLYDTMVNLLYTYTFYEVDMDQVLNKRSQLRDPNYLRDHLHLVDLRILKRFLNIFTINDSNKIFKNHVETALQYSILQKIIVQYTPANVESLVVPLEELWSI